MSGGAVAVPLGDTNGDGVGDLGLGPIDEPAAGRRCEPLDDGVTEEEIASSDDARVFQEAAQTVFGRPAFGRIDLEAVGGGGLRVRCPALPQLEDRGPPGSRISYGVPVGGTVAGAGDFDGDGLADVAVGSIAAAPRGRPGAGQVHVVLGGPGGVLDVRAAGDRVLRIEGPERASGLGGEVLALGDVDGDGFDDLALPYRAGVAAPDGRRLERGALHVAVVFGGPRGGAPIDLAAPGDRATVVRGLAGGRREFLGDEVVVAAAGDVDGDGRPDLAIGRPGAARLAGVVTAFGVTRRGAVIDAARERPLLRVRGQQGDVLGSAVAPAGDVDGDGRGDLAIGATIPAGSLVAPLPRGAVHVVPSRPGTTVDLSRSPAGVRTVLGPRVGGTRFGASVAPLGDVTGDGRTDLVVGAPDASPDCRHGAGAAYVVPGAAAGTTPVERAPGAWRIDGPRAAAAIGGQLAAGDVTGDGAPELLLSALPFPDSAQLDVRLLPATPPASVVAPLPAQRDCLRLTLRSRLGALRSGRALLRLRSSLGTGRRHRVAVELYVVPLRKRPSTISEVDAVTVGTGTRPAASATVRFAGPGRRSVPLRLRAPLRRRLAGAAAAYVELRAEQGSGGAFTGSFFVLAR